MPSFPRHLVALTLAENKSRPEWTAGAEVTLLHQSTDIEVKMSHSGMSQNVIP